MSSTFNILFYVRKNYVNKNGKSSIMIRITLNGEIVQFSSKLEIDLAQWDTKMSKAVGKSTEAMKINKLIEGMQASLINTYREIERTEAFVSAEKIRNVFLGYTNKEQSLLILFAKHNEEQKKLVGIKIAEATLEKYDRTYRRLEDFMKSKYDISDISLREINNEFIVAFETYLLSTCKCNGNTTAKFMQWFRKIIIIAKNNGWIFTDPFANYKIRLKKVDRGYLTDEELKAIIKKKLLTERLAAVRDIFIFCCVVGLAYIDVKNLADNNIRSVSDGSLWIMTKRQKTDVTVNVPILDIPKIILEKYKGKCGNKSVLPVLSNQKMNSYLKETAAIKERGCKRE